MYVLMSTLDQHNNMINLENIIDFDWYEWQLKLLRVTAMVVKFIETLRKLVKDGKIDELTARD